jgi:hypothetical protein
MGRQREEPDWMCITQMIFQVEHERAVYSHSAGDDFALDHNRAQVSFNPEKAQDGNGTTQLGQKCISQSRYNNGGRLAGCISPSIRPNFTSWPQSVTSAHIHSCGHLFGLLRRSSDAPPTLLRRSSEASADAPPALDNAALYLRPGSPRRHQRPSVERTGLLHGGNKKKKQNTNINTTNRDGASGCARKGSNSQGTSD